jgi:Leucine-rich repeat (LRR) protein
LNLLPQLPSQLARLNIDVNGNLVLDASPLTRLTCLWLQARGGIAEASRLPPSLKYLRLINTPLHANNLSLLSKGEVRKLSISTAEKLSAVALAELGQLTKLRFLDMNYGNVEAAAAASAAWKQLPQLQKLQIDMSRHDKHQPADAAEGEQPGHVVLQGLAAATQLTWLSLTVDRITMRCGSALARLINLQELELQGSSGVREDMLQLRALTRLKSLSIKQCGLDDTAAVALLGRLTGLQHLRVSSCSKVTDAVVPVIGLQLKGLHSLELLDLLGFGDATVQSLLELTQLKSLSVERLGLTGDGARQLWASAPFRITKLVVGRPLIRII